MTLSPLLKVMIIMNNYFHDVATALLLASAVIVWILGRKAERDGAQAAAWFASAYPLLTKFAWFSIAWIVIGGIPRTIFFNQVEWNMADPSNMYLFSALMVKHAAMWIAVFAGGWMWMKVRRVARSAGVAATDTTADLPSSA